MCTTDAHTLILFWSTEMELLVHFRTHTMKRTSSTLYFSYPENTDHALLYDTSGIYKFSTYDNPGVIDQYDIPDLQSLSEEELFQLMCVWEHTITVEQMLVLQEYLKDCVENGDREHDITIEV